MRILLVGHACDPYRGSEPGVTWNWAWHLSEQHEVWLVTRPRSREQIEHFLAANNRSTLNFRFVDVPSSIDPYKRQRGPRSLKLNYILWLREALREARALMSEMSFDVVHQVGWTTIAVPSPFWKLGRPFIWGPLGGGQRVPAQFKYLLGSGRVAECVREGNIALLPFRPAFRNAVRRSSRIFSVNEETTAVIRKAGRADAELFLDCGVAPELVRSSGEHRRNGETMTVLWAGAIEPRKALPLAIQAMAALGPSSNVKLVVAGDGPCRKECLSLCERLGVSRTVEFLGLVSLSRTYELMANSDVFLFTSIRDTFGSVVLEAAAHRLPIIALNHQGIAAWLPDAAAIRIPVEDPDSTVRSIAAAISNLERNPDTRCRLSGGAYSFACRNTWQERARKMTDIYAEAVSVPQTIV